MIGRIHTLFLLGAAALCLAAPALASADAPAWRALAVTAPTHLPPQSDTRQDVNERQLVAISATGGTFTLSFEGDATGPLPFDASAAVLQEALNDLPSVKDAGGQLTVSGGPENPATTAPYFVEFGGSFATSDVAQLIADPGALLGGAQSATVTTTVQASTIGKGKVAVTITNVGGEASDGTAITASFELPAGIVPKSSAECPAVGQQVSCSRAIAVQPGKTMSAGTVTGDTFTVDVEVLAGAPASAVVDVTVSGGGAEPHVVQLPIAVSSIDAQMGIAALWAGAFDADGVPYHVAGGHPHSAGAGFLVNTILSPNGGNTVPAGDPRDLYVELPPGFLGNPTATPRCPQGKAPCPHLAEASVGWAAPAAEHVGYSYNEGFQYRLTSREPSTGYAAQFYFKIAEAEASILGTLRSDSDYGVTVLAPQIPNVLKVYGAMNVLEGNPPGAAGKAFLTNPTNCSVAAPVTTMFGNTWQVSAMFPAISTPVPAITDCAALTEAWVGQGPNPTKPSFDFAPTDPGRAATPTGVSAEVSVPQDGLIDKGGRATAHLKRSVVTLPEGLTLNPAAGDGLEACSSQQIGLIGTGFPAPNPTRFDKSSPRCPDAAKIGAAEVKTPLLHDPLHGNVFLAAQEDNPFNSLLALYIVIEDPKTGILAKIPGEIRLDQQTGQQTALFDNNPQVPFTELNLRFQGGAGEPRSTLATPDLCGTYTTNGRWAPWSAADPDNPTAAETVETASSFTVTEGPGGAPCAQTKAQRPFDLGFAAGTTEPLSGAHSPFTLRITRPDGNQELDRIAVDTPPGLTATLKGLATCSEGAIAAAANRSGRDELASPSCPAGSQVGTTTVGVGVGPKPLYVKTGKVYLTPPYKGAPLSLAFVVPAVAGPFDLGVQVVRTALYVNPITAQVSAQSDTIPKMLRGIPLQIREVRVDLDRPGFTLNPTSCEQMAISARVQGASGAVSQLTNRFQVGQCKRLAFKPNLRLALHGSPKRAKYQRLVATVTAKPGEASIARTAVTMPHSVFLAQEHIRTVCTRVQFAADACPKGSIYGRAEAETPLLDGKLVGPVYLRSSDNLLPDVVVSLRGPDSQPIEVELAGRVDSKNKGIRNTFELIPDAPVSKFTLRMFGGQKSLLINSRNLCKGPKQRATVRMRAHNGKRRDFRPVVGNDCPKQKKAKGKKKR